MKGTKTAFRFPCFAKQPFQSRSSNLETCRATQQWGSYARAVPAGSLSTIL